MTDRNNQGVSARISDLVRQIIVLCKDDQVRTRIAIGSFELLIGRLQAGFPPRQDLEVTHPPRLQAGHTF
jgi:hypothetical protein